MSESVRLALFYDGSEGSVKAKEGLEAKGEKCNFHDIRDLKLPPGEEIQAPRLYAPEGTFQGWPEIEMFLKILPSARYPELTRVTSGVVE